MQALKKFLIRTLQFLAFGYVFICIGMSFAQSSMIFHPTHRPNKNAEWTTDDIDAAIPIYAGVVFGGKKPDHVYFLLHGNTGQADDREYIYKLLPPGSALYVLEYPGYGRRGGALIKDGFNATALRSYDYLDKQFLQTPISIIGESLGTGPASYIASKREVHSLYLIAPYHDLPGLAQEKYPWLPAWLLCAYRWDSAELLKNYKGQLTIIGIRDDEIIPVEHARRLARELPSSHLEIISGTHNDWDEGAIKNIFAQ